MAQLKKLHDWQWEQIERSFPGKSSLLRNDNRLFIEAIFWIVERKGTWAELPLQYGNWRAVYMRFRRWCAADFWRRLARSRRIDDYRVRFLLIQTEQFSRDYLQHTHQLKEKRARKTLNVEPENNKAVSIEGVSTSIQADEGAVKVHHAPTLDP